MVISVEAPRSSSDGFEDSPDSHPNIMVLTKSTIIPDAETSLGSELLEWKRQYWKKRIGGIKCVVAPMVDQSELAFRMLLRKHGAHLAYTPMIHASLFVSDPTYRKKAFSTCSEDRPLVVQFCANDPSTLATACRMVEGYCDGVDLNLGCPQVIAKKGHYGAYLQESPELIRRMIKAVHETCRLPLSVKIRVLGSLDETLAYAKMIEQAGASMLTVHGRTREQKGVATGMADWEIIKSVKQALDIPVIANGNIQRIGDIERCLEATEADAVMSAEGILSNPMLFNNQHLPTHQVAREYLLHAEKYRANASAVRAHLFRICHYSLLKYSDLRDRNSYVCNISQFQEIVDELEARHLTEWSSHASANPHIEEVVISASKVSLEASSLEEMVNCLPDWICKPYIRPASRSAELQTSTNSNKGEYRQQRRAMIEALSEQFSLSKTQIRKREHRRVEMQKKCKRKEYPKCVMCGQPSSANCQNESCRNCCSIKCIRGPFTCIAHRFVENQALQNKRKNYADKLGAAEEKLINPGLNNSASHAE